MYRIHFKFVDSEKRYTTQMMDSDNAMAFILGAYHSDLVIDTVEKYTKGSLMEWDIESLTKTSDDIEPHWEPVTF